MNKKFVGAPVLTLVQAAALLAWDSALADSGMVTEFVELSLRPQYSYGATNLTRLNSHEAFLHPRLIQSCWFVHGSHRW